MSLMNSATPYLCYTIHKTHFGFKNGVLIGEDFWGKKHKFNIWVWKWCLIGELSNHAGEIFAIRKIKSTTNHIHVSNKIGEYDC